MPPIYSGSLISKVEGSLGSRWNKRWAVITADALVFYAHAADHHLRPLIEETIELWKIARVEWLRKKEGTRFNVFVITENGDYASNHPSSDNMTDQSASIAKYRFMATSQGAAKLWIDQILLAVTTYRTTETEGELAGNKEAEIGVSTLKLNRTQMLNTISFSMHHVAADIELNMAGTDLRSRTKASMPSLFVVDESRSRRHPRIDDAEELAEKSPPNQSSPNPGRRVHKRNESVQLVDKSIVLKVPFSNIPESPSQHVRSASAQISSRNSKVASSFQQSLLSLASQVFPEREYIAEIRRSVLLLATDARLVSFLICTAFNRPIPREYEWAKCTLPGLWSKLLNETKIFAVLNEACQSEDDTVVRIVELYWKLLCRHKQLNCTRYASDAVRDLFCQFIRENVACDRFTSGVKEKLIELMTDCHDVDENAVNIWMGQKIENPEIWKSLLLSTIDCCARVKNELLKDITSFVLHSSKNIDSLTSQPDWLEWILQPVEFSILNDQRNHVSSHNALRLNFLCALFDDMFFRSLNFGYALCDALRRIYLWGSSSLPAARSLVEVIVNKLTSQRNLFPHEFNTLPWKNLVQFIHIAQTYLFATRDWGVQTQITSKYFMEGIVASQNDPSTQQLSQSTTGMHQFERFGIHMDRDDIVLSHKLCSLLRALRLDQPRGLLGFCTGTEQNSIAANAIMMSATESFRVLRISTLAHALLLARDDSIGVVQNAIAARLIMDARNQSDDVLSTLQRLCMLPLSEQGKQTMLNSLELEQWLNDHVFTRSQGNSKAPIKIIAEVLSQLDVKTHTYRLKSYKRTFMSQELVQLLMKQRICSDVDSSILFGLMLHGFHFIEHITNSAGFSDDEMLFRIVEPISSRKDQHRRSCFTPHTGGNTVIDANQIAVTVPQDKNSIVFRVVANSRFSDIDPEPSMTSTMHSNLTRSPSHGGINQQSMIRQIFNEVSRRGRSFPPLFRGRDLVDFLLDRRIATSVPHAIELCELLLHQNHLIPLGQIPPIRHSSRYQSFSVNMKNRLTATAAANASFTNDDALFRLVF